MAPLGVVGDGRRGELRQPPLRFGLARRERDGRRQGGAVGDRLAGYIARIGQGSRRGPQVGFIRQRAGGHPGAAERREDGIGGTVGFQNRARRADGNAAGDVQRQVKQNLVVTPLRIG